MWLNFTRYGDESMYLFYPVILIGISVFILFLPAPILYHRSRFWFLYANVCTGVHLIIDSTDSDTVEAFLFRIIPRRIPRLLLGRHVLFSDLCLGCKLFCSGYGNPTY